MWVAGWLVCGWTWVGRVIGEYVLSLEILGDGVELRLSYVVFGVVMGS